MIFLSENKSEKYNECIREFIDQKFYKRLFVSNPSTYFSITFTMKQTLNDMKLDEINFSQDFRHFMNRLNYKIFKNSYKRFNRRLNVIPILEKSNNDRFHYHCLIEKPFRLKDREFTNLIESEFSKTKLSYDDIDIKRQSKPISSFSSYTTKRRNYNIVDFNNLYI